MTHIVTQGAPMPTPTAIATSETWMHNCHTADIVSCVGFQRRKVKSHRVLLK